MAGRIVSRLRRGWNLFTNHDKSDRVVLRDMPIYMRAGGNYGAHATFDSAVRSLYTRLAIDVASLTYEVGKVDEYENFVNKVTTPLSKCLALQANVDQTSTDFFIDLAFTMFENGAAAIVPIDTDIDPTTGAYSINSMRVGRIISYAMDTVDVELFNPYVGYRKQYTLHKDYCAIVQNPMAEMMGSNNQTVQRLLRKINILDKQDADAASNPLDLAITVPYKRSGNVRNAQAALQLQEIEQQLKGGSHGVILLDQTEKLTQLNRPVNNNLSPQITELTARLYQELGIPEELLTGTATPQVISNYMGRTIMPIARNIASAMTASFISKTAYAQGQRVLVRNDPFASLSIDTLAPVFDSLSRNAITSSNELRAKIGLPPVDDADANALRNKNLNISKEEIANGEHPAESDDV